MRRKTTKELLAGAFRELAGEKPIDKITVGEIAEHSGYSPATFYRQFRDKYDLIAWDYAQRVEEIMARTDREDYPWKKTLLDGALSFQAERPYLVNLLRNTNGHDSFIHYMAEINYHVLRQHIRKNCGRAELDEMTEMYIRLYVLGTVSLTCEWILGRYEASPEMLAEVYEKSLPAPLYPYLLRK